MINNIKSILVGTLVAATFTLSACSSTDANKQQVANTAVDKDGLPVLTDEQKDDGIICVRKPVTGSRLSKKYCSTPEQRARAQSEAQRTTQEVMRKSTGPTISDF